MRRRRDPVGPGQESVWDYPRPPRLEPTGRRVEVIFGGAVIADTRRGFRVLETSHPPSFYIPREDCAEEHLEAVDRTSWCEWKGHASYLSIHAGGRVETAAAWFYPEPTPAFAAITGHVAFYPSRMDECRVDGERVRTQEGDFYGGWITDEIIGPFKGAPGTLGW